MVMVVVAVVNVNVKVGLIAMTRSDFGGARSDSPGRRMKTGEPHARLGGGGFRNVIRNCDGAIQSDPRILAIRADRSSSIFADGTTKSQRRSCRCRNGEYTVMPSHSASTHASARSCISSRTQTAQRDCSQPCLNSSGLPRIQTFELSQATLQLRAPDGPCGLTGCSQRGPSVRRDDDEDVGKISVCNAYVWCFMPVGSGDRGFTVGGPSLHAQQRCVYISGRRPQVGDVDGRHIRRAGNRNIKFYMMHMNIRPIRMKFVLRYTWVLICREKWRRASEYRT